MAWLLTSAIVLVLLIAAVLAYAATKPDTLQIRRATRIQAPPERIFALINDFQKWPAWAPQDRSDPAMKRTYSGAPQGLGAVSEWSGRGNAGAGRMEIVASEPPARIAVRVEFSRPFQASNLNEFNLEPTGEATLLTWSMEGTNPFLAKFMSVFFNMDKMMGRHFEQGLENLKKLAES